MPRGRHRFSSPIARLLPPTGVAVSGLGCAAAAWLLADGEAGQFRWLATAAAAAAVSGAVLLRKWDRTAALKLQESESSRIREEIKQQEEAAELTAELDESRQLRTVLGDQLRQTRAELDRLRSEHAALLRRYATAETERASALEGRRLLAIEASEQPKALLPAGADRRPGKLSAATYLRASVALRQLAENAARQGLGESPAPAADGFDYFGLDSAPAVPALPAQAEPVEPPLAAAEPEAPEEPQEQAEEAEPVAEKPVTAEKPAEAAAPEEPAEAAEEPPAALERRSDPQRAISRVIDLEAAS